FRVEIGQIAFAGFSDVSGLGVELETEDYREGGANEYVHKLRRGIKYPNLVLRRGVADADALWKWQQSVANPKNKVDRRDVRVILLNSEGKDAVSWRCRQAHPVRWVGPEL